MVRRRKLTRRSRRYAYAVAACGVLVLAFALTRAPAPEPAPRVASLVSSAAKAAWLPVREVPEDAFDLSKATEKSRRERFHEHSVGGFIASAVGENQEAAGAAVTDEFPAEPAVPADSGELASERALVELNRELADLRDHFAKTDSPTRVLWIERLLVDLEHAHVAVSREGFPDAADEITEARRLLTFVQPAARGETAGRETEPSRVAWRIAGALRCCEEALAKVTGEQGS